MTAAAAVPTPAARRPGYDADAAATARRVLPMLATERVIWFSTVRPDGAPHLVPTWFHWDGEAILAWSKPGAVKVRNLAADPRLMVALGDPADDFAVGLIEARAELLGGLRPAPDGFFERYRDDLAAVGISPDEYRATYTQCIRVTPVRFLAWHGRDRRHDVPALVPRPCRFVGLAALVARSLDGLAGRLRAAALTPVPADAP